MINLKFFEEPVKRVKTDNRGDRDTAMGNYEHPLPVKDGTTTPARTGDL